MRKLLGVGVLAAIGASAFAAWIAVHSFVDHSHVDRFHLAVAFGSAGVGLYFLYRLLRRSRA